MYNPATATSIRKGEYGSSLGKVKNCYFRDVEYIIKRVQENLKELELDTSAFGPCQ
jgi:hypothetical protein